MLNCAFKDVLDRVDSRVNLLDYQKVIYKDPPQKFLRIHLLPIALLKFVEALIIV